MAFSLKDIIFSSKFWTASDIKTDPNKDGNGKGTLQRYNEMLGDDFDTDLQPFIENLVANNLDPDTALLKLLIYLELLLLPVILGTDEDMRRRVLKYISHFNRIKGTAYGYEIMFSMLGMDMVIVETWNNFTWDDPIEDLDGDTRVFDTSCYNCSSYSIILTSMGAPIVVTAEILDAIFNVVQYNEPINANLQKVELDGTCLVQEIITIAVIANGDLTYNNQDSPGTFLEVDINDDIFVSGDHANKYSISSEGDLLYNC